MAINILSIKARRAKKIYHVGTEQPNLIVVHGSTIRINL